MGFINLAEKTISAKLVYYGVGVGGKTTSLQQVHGILCPRDEVQLVSINTEEDSTLLFDFLPINLGQVEGYKIRIQGFTVPGQPKYKMMRKFVLQGADAVVFVVDSQASRLEENLESLEGMFENLRANGLDPESIPTVVQYNKRDLDDILGEAELDRHFRYRDDILSFPSVATDGQGVFETFVHAAGLLIDSKLRAYGLGKNRVDPADVVDAATRKLWAIHDDVRGPVEERPERPTVALRMPESGPGPLDDPDGADDGDFRETDFEFDLADDAPAPVEARDAVAAAPEDGEASQMLDKAVRSNLQLAEKFGELDEHRRLLERKNRELVELAQNTVHDLNHPLAAIKLMLSSMDRGLLGELGGKLSDGVQHGLLAVEQMERLLLDLMDSSRLDFDGVEMAFQDVDMTLLVADVVRNLRYEIEEHDVGIRIEPLPTIVADEWALNKAFTNLIANSIKYSHPDRRPVIAVSCVEELDRRVFMVADNGLGIPEGETDRLFARFERGTNTGGTSGTGLGLHIVKEAVRGHGGEVWVESVEGHGSRFCLALPNEPVMPAHSTVSETAELADL